jgi:hypothetical protein
MIYAHARRKVGYWQWETTVPLDLQDKVGMDGLNDFAKLSDEFVTEYLRKEGYIPDVPGLKVGSVVAPHYWHSDDPFGSSYHGFHPHCHGVTFNFGFDGEKVVDFDKLWISNDEGFLKLRASYRSALERRYGRSVARDVNIHMHYETDTSMLYHRLWYSLRSPIFDVCKYLRAIHRVPSDFDPSWLKTMLRGRGHAQRVIYRGWMASVCQSSNSPFMRHLKLTLLSRKAYRDERKKVYCPFKDERGGACGCLMEANRFAVDDTSALIARGALFLVRLRSPLVVLHLDGG